MAVTDACMTPEPIAKALPKGAEGEKAGLRRLTAGAGRWATRLLPVVLLLLAGAVLWTEFGRLDTGRVAEAVAAWGPQRLAAAAGLTALSFALLGLLEWLGLRWAGARVPLGVSLLGSFCASAFAHTLGFALLSGSAVRARLYARHDASLVAVAQTTLFAGVAFGLGISALGGGALLAAPRLAAYGVGFSEPVLRLVAVLMLAAPVLYVAACALVRAPIRIGGQSLSLPSPLTAAAQAVLGFVDSAATALVPWVLLPAGKVGFAAFTTAYVSGTVLGLASHVPGGAGVFEGSVLALLPGVSRPDLAAAFLGYRLIYYLAPLALAAVLIAGASLAPSLSFGRARRIWRGLAPPLLAATAFALGAVLILTGIAQIDPDRLQLLEGAVPVLVLETSHLVSLVAGLGLMGVAVSLFRRRAQAVPVAIAASAIAASTALLRGLDIGPSISAAAFGLALFGSRGAFRRRGAWRADGLMSWWLLGLAAVVAGAVALGLWVYEDTPYEARLWAEVGYHADPSRFLRSVAILGAALLLAGARALVRSGSPPAEPTSVLDLDAIRPLVDANSDTTARLALLGDKALLQSDKGGAFIMYGAEGRSLIAMGDPVGDRAEGSALLWRLKELADSADGRVIFYHASPAWLTEYLDIGLTPIKLGEEARVRLPDFTLEGGKRRNLRQGHSKALREGLTFEIVQPPQSDALMAELRLISDAWLTLHGGREKGFSLGRFDPAILRRDPIALVRQDGDIVAFANVWLGGAVEVSVDLMRHVPDAPHGVMDFLFVETINWAKAQGYQWFNLGMAPLTGMAQHPLAPLWHKIGAQVARRGGRFYGFTGLRAFKAKFDPVWTPRYLAAPPLALPAALIDVARLISRPPMELTHA